MVGIFLGYYGAGHLLRNLRHNDDVLCLLRAYKTGTSGEKKNLFLFIITINEILFETGTEHAGCTRSPVPDNFPQESQETQI